MGTVIIPLDTQGTELRSVTSSRSHGQEGADLKFNPVLVTPDPELLNLHFSYRHASGVEQSLATDCLVLGYWGLTLVVMFPPAGGLRAGGTNMVAIDARRGVGMGEEEIGNFGPESPESTF